LLASLVYLAVRGLIEPALLRRRCGESKELEIVVLRHELAIVRRRVARPTTGGSGVPRRRQPPPAP
jgi:hypothetical protein